MKEIFKLKKIKENIRVIYKIKNRSMWICIYLYNENNK